MTEQRLGALILDGSFWCDECLTRQKKDVKEPYDTPVFDDDEWFHGELCSECGELVEVKP